MESPFSYCVVSVVFCFAVCVLLLYYSYSYIFRKKKLGCGDHGNLPSFGEELKLPIALPLVTQLKHASTLAARLRISRMTVGDILYPTAEPYDHIRICWTIREISRRTYSTCTESRESGKVPLPKRSRRGSSWSEEENLAYITSLTGIGGLGTLERR